MARSNRARLNRSLMATQSRPSHKPQPARWEQRRQRDERAHIDRRDWRGRSAPASAATAATEPPMRVATPTLIREVRRKPLPGSPDVGDADVLDELGARRDQVDERDLSRRGASELDRAGCRPGYLEHRLDCLRRANGEDVVLPGARYEACRSEEHTSELQSLR